MTHRSTIQKLCRKIGLPLGKCSRHDGTSWSYNGKVLDIRSRYDGFMGGRPDSDAMHDVAHWLCCPPDRRLHPEFGLGKGVDRRSMYAPLLVTQDEADDEEVSASMLGILMERAAGMDWQATWTEHNWGDHPLTYIKEERRTLDERLGSLGYVTLEILETVRRVAT